MSMVERSPMNVFKAQVPAIEQSANLLYFKSAEDLYSNNAKCLYLNSVKQIKCATFVFKMKIVLYRWHSNW